MAKLTGWLIAALVLTGCGSIAPSTNIQQPMTARPAPKPTVAYNDGAIFHGGQGEVRLFEDRRPRNVGDILTISIVEKTSANEKLSNSADHSTALNAASPSVNSVGAATKLLLTPLKLAGSSSNKFANNNANATSNDFTGTITVTVIDVLPNGNLVVSGEKQIAINQANEYIRFSGVVNPISIVNNANGNNIVPSTQVADAHLEYKGSAYALDSASTMSLLGRLFQSVLPF